MKETTFVFQNFSHPETVSRQISLLGEFKAVKQAEKDFDASPIEHIGLVLHVGNVIEAPVISKPRGLRATSSKFSKYGLLPLEVMSQDQRRSRLLYYVTSMAEQCVGFRGAEIDKAHL